MFTEATYDFTEIASDCHNDTWDYNKKEKIGYSSVRRFDYFTCTLSWLSEDDEDFTPQGWMTECLSWNEEYIIDWEGDGCKRIMKEIANRYSSPVYFRLDACNSGVIAVDYNTRKVYLDTCDGFNSVSFYKVKNGEVDYVD